MELTNPELPKNIKKSIDNAINVLKRYYPFIIGWKYRVGYLTSRTIKIDIICDIDKVSEFYDTTINYLYDFSSDINKNEEYHNVAYPFSVTDIKRNWTPNKQYQEFSEIQETLDEIFELTPEEERTVDIDLWNGVIDELHIENSIFFNNKKNIKESIRKILREESNKIFESHVDGKGVNYIKDKDKSPKDNNDLCDELTISSLKELRQKMRGMKISQKDRKEVNRLIKNMKRDAKYLSSDLDVFDTYTHMIQGVLCTYSKEDKYNID